jgi:peroxiredoxin
MSTVSNAARPPAIGDVAPDFELDDRTGGRRRLSDLRGAPVLLAFHPPHWDPAWPESVRAYNGLIANLPGIAALDC